MSVLVGLVALEIGLLIGALIPRHTEGVLLIIAFFGIGMSLQGEVAKLFPTYPAKQLFRSGLFAEDPLVFPFVSEELLVFIILMAVTIISWYLEQGSTAVSMLKRARSRGLPLSTLQRT